MPPGIVVDGDRIQTGDRLQGHRIELDQRSTRQPSGSRRLSGRGSGLHAWPRRGRGRLLGGGRGIGHLSRAGGGQYSHHNDSPHDWGDVEKGLLVQSLQSWCSTASGKKACQANQKSLRWGRRANFVPCSSPAIASPRSDQVVPVSTSRKVVSPILSNVRRRPSMTGSKATAV